jgi:F-type H+-transporting ATPase subunit delta
MISSAIFARYGRALADVALANSEEAKVKQDLGVYREIFLKVPALLDALDSPAVQREAKVRVLDELLRHYPVCSTVANLLRITLDHHRIRYFEEISTFYFKTVDERKGIVAARVTSAIPIPEKDLAALRKSLATAAGNEVTLSMDTDPGLLAGAIVQIGSTVYDGSIRTQLEEMKRRLARQ